MALPSTGPEVESPNVLNQSHTEPFFATLLGEEAQTRAPHHKPGNQRMLFLPIA